MAQDKKIAADPATPPAQPPSFGARMAAGAGAASTASPSAEPSGPPPIPGAVATAPGGKIEPVLSPFAALATPPAAPASGAATAVKLTPLPLPPPAPRPAPAQAPINDASAQLPGAGDGDDAEAGSTRRAARRRPAGPVRNRVAANDDAPSIGGLIYALEQKPTNKPFIYAGIASAVWGLIAIGFSYAIVSAELNAGSTFGDIVAKPTTFLTAAAVVVPIAVLWFLALLAWRSEELRLRSSTMTEVAVRLAEPDRMAEQSVASLGQAVRRQVSFMNDAVSRALGRAGELEALVHHEVSELERSYEVNERKIRGLINELSGERHALLDTSDKVSDSLRHLGTEIPVLIEKLSSQQINLAGIIKGAGDNLTALESAMGTSADRLENTLGTRTEQLQGILETYTSALSTALGSRSEQMQSSFENYMKTLDTSLGNRTDNLQTVFEEYARALDTTLSNRAQALDIQLVERTKSLDAAFNERLRLFDESIMRSTLAIDGAVGEKARALTTALDSHAKTFNETISRQAHELDESLMHGINAVRRSSENITRQSLKAIEGLAGQSDMLRNVSENLLSQVNNVTNRFESQGQAILHAANSLEAANFKIDNTLQTRHSELSQTLERMSGKADEFGRFVEDYSSSMEGTLSSAETRTRSAAEDLQRRFSAVSSAVDQQLSSLSSRVDQTAEEARARTAKTASEVAAEQAWLREQLEKMPAATRENASSMRQALQDQLKALEQMSSLAGRPRDVSQPLPSLTGAYASETRIDPSRGLPSPGGHRPPALPPEGPPLSRPLPDGPPMSRQPPMGRGAPAADPREAWSLGDLLARASRDDGHGDHDPAPGQWGATQFPLNIDVIARAIDPATTAAVWARIRSGQRGVMVRSIYSPDGRAAFDEVSRRYKTDPELQSTINRYLGDFERIKTEAEMKDPSGRMAQSHLVSDTGRVYLFLAHASGRLA
jgi:hypothetical protein